MIYNIREFNSNGFLGYVSEKKVYFSFYDKDKNDLIPVVSIVIPPIIEALNNFPKILLEGRTSQNIKVPSIVFVKTSEEPKEEYTIILTWYYQVKIVPLIFNRT